MMEITADEWLRVLVDRYEPHPLPDEVLSVARAEAELAHRVDGMHDYVFAAASRAIQSAGLSVDSEGTLLVAPEPPSWFDAEDELSDVQKARANADAAPLRRRRIDPFAPAPEEQPEQEQAEDPAARRRWLYAPHKREDPPTVEETETAPQIDSGEPQTAPDGEDTGHEVSEPLSPVPEWDSSQPLKSVQAWHTSVIVAAPSKTALRVAGALSIVADSRDGTAYLTDDVAAERFGIPRSTLHRGRQELADAGFITKHRKNRFNVQVWRLTTPTDQSPDSRDSPRRVSVLRALTRVPVFGTTRVPIPGTTRVPKVGTQTVINRPRDRPRPCIEGPPSARTLGGLDQIGIGRSG